MSNIDEFVQSRMELCKRNASKYTKGGMSIFMLNPAEKQIDYFFHERDSPGWNSCLMALTSVEKEAVQKYNPEMNVVIVAMTPDPSDAKKKKCRLTMFELGPAEDDVTTEPPPLDAPSSMVEK